VYLKDIQVVFNPDSIPIVVPILSVSPIDVDLGEDCQIQSLVVANKNIWVRAAARISPVPPFAVTEVRTDALYHYDLSALLSSVLRLNGGIMQGPWGRWVGRVGRWGRKADVSD